MLKQNNINELAQALGEHLLKRQLKCAVAESCTGGSLAAAITDIPGSSAWFDRGFVTYTDQSKIEMLGVPAGDILSEGAVSESVVSAMAKGVIFNSDADVSMAITGIAGPSGGRPGKPVGTVWIAWALDFQRVNFKCYHFHGDRSSIRQQSVEAALNGLIQLILKKEQVNVR